MKLEMDGYRIERSGRSALLATLTDGDEERRYLLCPTEAGRVWAWGMYSQEVADAGLDVLLWVEDTLGAAYRRYCTYLEVEVSNERKWVEVRAKREAEREWQKGLQGEIMDRLWEKITRGEEMANAD